MIRSPVSWYGGKCRLVDWLLMFVPADVRTFGDWFGGSGVVVANVPAPVRVYNDINKEIVFLFRVIRESPDELIRLLSYTPYARGEFQRCLQTDVDDRLERARRIFVKHRMMWGGGGRVADGTNDWNYSVGDTARDMSSAVSRFLTNVMRVRLFAEAFRTVQIENLDFEDVIGRYDTVDTLHFCDPPYVLETRADNRQRYAFEMDEAGHRRLAEVLQGVEGMAMVCGYAGRLYDELYAGWQRVDKDSVVVAGKGTNRKQVESLWLNPALCERLALQERKPVQLALV